VDPTGQLYSPYYDKNGDFLGLDEKGWSGDIYITSKDLFDKLKNKDGVVNSQQIQAYKATRTYNNDYLNNHPTLTPEAESKISTHILQNLKEADLSNLYNGKVSVLEGTANNGTIGIGYNDPNLETGRLLFDKTANGQYRITAKLGELKSLGTVEAVWNYLWVHELQSHGILGIPGTGNQKAHQQAYRNQYNHWTYPFLSLDQKKEIKNRMNGIW